MSDEVKVSEKKEGYFPIDLLSKGTVLEKNKNQELITLRDVIESDKFCNSECILPVVIGQDKDGNIVTGDLVQMKHVMIGAKDAVEKSYINSMITSIFYWVPYENIILKEMDTKNNTRDHSLWHIAYLDDLIREMHTRFELFSKMGINNLEEYNKMLSENDGRYQKLPYFIVVISEFENLIADYGAKSEDVIRRLLMTGSEAGIHLIITTNKPVYTTFTRDLSEIVPIRIAFRTDTAAESGLILGVSGAEKLCGRGDMLYMTCDLIKPVQLQGCTVTDSEKREVVDYGWKKNHENWRDELCQFDDYRNIYVECYSRLISESVWQDLDETNDMIKLIPGGKEHVTVKRIIGDEWKYTIDDIDIFVKISYLGNMRITIGDSEETYVYPSDLLHLRYLMWKNEVYPKSPELLTKEYLQNWLKKHEEDDDDYFHIYDYIEDRIRGDER